MDKNEINFFGLTTFRNERKKFGIKIDDRRRHFYCIGKTGMGKSNLMENMAIQDIQAGRGIAYVDPHGEGAEKLLNFIPASRINDVVFFNPADLDYPIAFNVMEKVDFRYRHLIAGGLMGVFKKVWPDVWSARMEYILNNTIQNKVGQFISNPLIRNLIGQVKSTIDMRDIMDKEKIFIMDLSKGRIGEDNSHLLGALLITRLQLAAMSRVDIPEEDRKDFYLYVDEFQNFVTESFANILSEARKYRLNLTLGHQYIAQLGTGADAKVRDAVFGNVGTLAVFRVGAEDAEYLEREFTPQFTAEDLVNLPKYNVYLKLMIDGVAGHPFSAETLPPPKPMEESSKEKIIRASRERYGIKREIVEEKISRWSGFGQEEEVKPSFSAPQRNNSPQSAPAFQGAEQTKLYDAICSNCGKSTKVIFPPEPGRAVYCKSCLKKMKAEQEQVKIENVSFHNPKNSGQKHDEGREEERGHQDKPHRKEINLSELKKALEESLSKKPEHDESEKKKVMKTGETVKL
ncbi:MAG: type IV secretion system DNA-binding domain-containing protein [Candidatus Staskawiczbacteria bacterium]|nr:type IV secretion system DNA-binding domain-containing protein [Candidatus Staskawiczbacteria bacterium]